MLTPAQQLSSMIVLAATEHADDFDKGGMPYILHPLKVAHYLKTSDLELMVIAIGHDLVEDHGNTVTFKRLLDMGFSTRVVEGIRCLTKMPGETQEEYEDKVLSNIDAVRVKMEDLRHNSDIRRLKGISERDIRRVEKYHHLYLRLKGRLAERPV